MDIYEEIPFLINYKFEFILNQHEHTVCHNFISIFNLNYIYF